MATLTRGTGANKPSLATTLNDPGPHQIHGRAAAAYLAGDMVYLSDVGGVPTLTIASGAAATGPALLVGMLMKDAPAGEKAVAYHGVEVEYAGSGITAGARYYLSATPGALDDGATTGGTVPAAIGTNSTNLFILSPTR